MSTELQKYESNDLDWNCPNTLQTLKEIFAKKATKEEFNIFVNLGKVTGLNPYLREIWLIKYGDSAATIFVGRDGYRKSAQASQNYDYHLVDAVYSNDNFTVNNGEVSHQYRITDRGHLVGAYCITKRRSSTLPLFVYVELKEYDTNKSNWATKKATMIKKVAEAQCLRMAFQELFANTYSDAEYVPEDNSKENKHTKLKEKLANLIEGQSHPVSNLKEILQLIENAITLEDLDNIVDKAKFLPTAEERNEARVKYREKLNKISEADHDRALAQTEGRKGTTEIPQSPSEEESKKPSIPGTQYEKIKQQLLKAQSQDTLDIACDLILTCETEEEQQDLREIYNERKSIL